MSIKFKREDRYIVFKLSDLGNFATDPAVNGGWKLVPVDAAAPEIKP